MQILENPGKIFEIPKIQRKSQKSHQNPESTSEIPKIPEKSKKSQNYIQCEYMKCAHNMNLSEIKIINVFVLMFETDLVVKTVQPY